MDIVFDAGITTQIHTIEAIIRQPLLGMERAIRSRIERANLCLVVASFLGCPVQILKTLGAEKLFFLGAIVHSANTLTELAHDGLRVPFVSVGETFHYEVYLIL